jgi:hypothetical protein
MTADRLDCRGDPRHGQPGLLERHRQADLLHVGLQERAGPSRGTRMPSSTSRSTWASVTPARSASPDAESPFMLPSSWELGSSLGEGRSLRAGSWLRAASGADGRVPRRCGSGLVAAGERPGLRQECMPELCSGPRTNLRSGPRSDRFPGRRLPEMVSSLWRGLNKPVLEAGVEVEGVRAG